MWNEQGKEWLGISMSQCLGNFYHRDEGAGAAQELPEKILEIRKECGVILLSLFLWEWAALEKGPNCWNNPEILFLTS